MVDFLWDNKVWLFDGIGALAFVGLVGWMFNRKRASSTIKQSQRSGLQAGRDINLNVQAPPSLPSGIAASERVVLDSMPKLVSELQRGLSHPQGEFIREFVVLPNPRVIFDPSKPRIVLYLENFEDVNLTG